MRRYFAACRQAFLIPVLLVATWVQHARAETTGTPVTLDPGITESVKEIMARQAAVGNQRVPRARRGAIRAVHQSISQLGASDVSQSPLAANIREFEAGTRAAPAVGTSFLTCTRTEALTVPPDTMGGVSPTQVLVCLNGRFKLFDRIGTANPALDVDSDIFFDSVRNTAETSTPRVRFDRLSQRWFITMLNTATVNRIMLAVSSGPVINDASSFTLFQFQHDFGTPDGDADKGTFADYNTLGIDASALYIGVNIFTKQSAGMYKGASGFVINKAGLTGGTLTITPFRHLSTAAQSGIFSPQGVDNDDPNATEGYFIGVDNLLSDQLIMFRMTGVSGSPILSTPIIIKVPETGNRSVGGVPALGSSQLIDDLDYRLVLASMRNGSLYTAHNIEVNTAGVAAASGGRDAARWYEFTNLATTPVLRQSGTLFDPAQTGPRNFIFPTCVVNGQGHMALACTACSSSERLNILVTGRLAGDPLGTLQPPAVAVQSTANYNADLSSPLQRWGDYSMTLVDPTDNMTFWTFQEYCVTTDIWGVQAVQLKAPPPAKPLSALPQSIQPNAQNVNVIITGDVSNGAGFYDPGAAFPKRLAAAFSGTGIVINSITFADPAHIVLNVSVTNAAPGPRALTVTNPDGQTAISAPGILCVAPAGSANATAFSVTGPTSAKSGTPFLFQVSATDSCGQPVASYAGTVHFTSSDPGATLPADYTFVPADNGSRVFMATLVQIGDVTLTATDAANSFTGALLINVTSGPVITVRPSASPNPGVVGVPVNFTVTATTTAPPLTYAWDFGDTTSGTGQTPLHVYAAAGTYTATVTITDANGGMASASVQVTVSPPPAITSGPTATPNPAGVGGQVAFSVTATDSGGGPLLFVWDFGDGTTANGSSPAHIYTSANIFNATVTVTDTRGGKTSASIAVVVKAPVVGTGDDVDGDGFSDAFENSFGTDPNDPTSTPLDGQPAGSVLPLTVTRLNTRVYFIRLGNDFVTMSGKLPVPAGFSPAGAKVAVDVSGISRLFHLDLRGRALGGFSLQPKSGRFRLQLVNGDFGATLAAAGLTNSDVLNKGVSLSVTVLFEGSVYQNQKPQLYTAHVNKIGRSR